eukprot:145234_1
MSLDYGIELYLSMSSSAVIHGLKNRPELNGCFGTIAKYVQEKQRYHVQATIEGTKFNILLKKENLIFVSNIHELINAKNQAYSTLPFLLKALNFKKKQFDDDEKHYQNVTELNKSDIVLIHNLKNKQEFNDLFAEIIDFDSKSGRYYIKFEYKSKIEKKSLKPINLRLVFPSKYSKYTDIKCVRCWTPILSSKQLLTCPGCASLYYCSGKCRNEHLFKVGHIGETCYIYRCNMLYNVLNFKYILYERFSEFDINQFEKKEISDLKKFYNGPNRQQTSIKTNINNWGDWVKHFGFDYKICYNHTYPMTLFHIVKEYFLKYTKSQKKMININLVGCKDNEFAGIEKLGVCKSINHPITPMTEDWIDEWKWRWKLMSYLLEPLKININCYGDELNTYCTGFKTSNLTMSVTKGLYLPDKYTDDHVDIVIGLNGGIHEHKKDWMPVLKYCIQNKIPMMFTEYCMVEYKLYLEEIWTALGVDNNLIVGFNPFRDPSLLLSPFTRRVCSINSFIYGIIQYE